MDNCDYCSDEYSCDTCSADYEYDYSLGMCMYVDTTVVCMDYCESCVVAAECDECFSGYNYVSGQCVMDMTCPEGMYMDNYTT